MSRKSKVAIAILAFSVILLVGYILIRNGYQKDLSSYMQGNTNEDTYVPIQGNLNEYNYREAIESCLMTYPKADFFADDASINLGELSDYQVTGYQEEESSFEQGYSIGYALTPSDDIRCRVDYKYDNGKITELTVTIIN